MGVARDFGADRRVLGVVPAWCDVAGGTELTTADVDQGWLKERLREVPATATPLSQFEFGLSLPVSVAAGATTAEVRVPTVKDDVREPEESMRAQLTTYDAAWEPVPGAEFVGTVRDAS
ncbi:hypothetical protein ACFY8C_30035 [Streptomyces flavochromogenes]|uniref:Uncharacterized protein n=1 Tax=Streptomyces flavochromogenes TaxID=68199 RepID=A0ABW6XYF6_9ACTN